MTHLIWKCVLTLNTSNNLSVIITGHWLLYDLNNHSSYFKTQNLLEKMSCARVYGSNKLSLILRLWGYGTLCNLEIIHSFLDVELREKFYVLDLARIAITYFTISKLLKELFSGTLTVFRCQLFEKIYKCWIVFLTSILFEKFCNEQAFL